MSMLQLPLPGSEKFFPETDFDRARVEHYVGQIEPTLRPCQIQPSVVVEILCNPTPFWKRTIKVDHVKCKTRICWSPLVQLRKIQRALLLQLRLPKGFPSMAFEPADSIIWNARCHIGNKASLMVDLKNAYESIKTKHVQRYLRREQYCSKAEAWVIARLITYRGLLRMGAPISGWIFNAMLHRFDQEVLTVFGAPTIAMRHDDESSVSLFYKAGRKPRPHSHGIVYTRYADNLCISVPGTWVRGITENMLEKVLARHHLTLNPDKTVHGHNGRLFFPGIELSDNKIYPNMDYLSWFAYQFHLKQLLPQQLMGHLCYQRMFGDSVYQDLRQAFPTPGGEDALAELPMYWQMEDPYENC